LPAGFVPAKTAHLLQSASERSGFSMDAAVGKSAKLFHAVKRFGYMHMSNLVLRSKTRTLTGKTRMLAQNLIAQVGVAPDPECSKNRLEVQFN